MEKKFMTKLFQFQEDGVIKMEEIFIDHRCLLLADQPGLGKTIQALSVAIGLGYENVLILCPPTLRSVWKNEALKHFGMPVNLPKPDKPVAVDGWNCAAYSTIWRPSHDGFRRRKKWDLVICDEAHLLKSFGLINGGDSKVATCVYGEILPAAGKVIMITGTPIKNRPSEFWPLAQLLMPDVPVMRDRYLFAKRYCNGYKGRFGYDDSGHSNIPELRARMDPLMVRRLKKDVLKDLPPKLISVIELPPTQEMKVALDFDTGEIAMGIEAIGKIRERMADAKEANSIESFKAAQNALKEVTAHSMDELARLRSKLSKAKAHAAVEYLKIMLDGGVDSVVVGVWHKEAAEILADGLKGYGVHVLTGATLMKERERIVAEFQAGEGRVFIGQILAAGVGLTLTRSSTVVMVEVPYSPSELSQFLDRCHRIGQTDSVDVHLLAVQDSVDVHVMRSLAKKVEVIAALMDGRAMKKRESGRIHATLPLDELGRAMGRPVRDWAWMAIYKLWRASEGGGVADGKGFSGADEHEGRRLAGLKGVPTDADFGSMAQLVARHRAQVTDRPEMLAIVMSLVTGGVAA
jgi:SWI/SNF-related matrix-associated actin-dependent regulator 1 of chromatin subfamily A